MWFLVIKWKTKNTTLLEQFQKSKRKIVEKGTIDILQTAYSIYPYNRYSYDWWLMSNYETQLLYHIHDIHFSHGFYCDSHCLNPLVYCLCFCPFIFTIVLFVFLRFTTSDYPLVSSKVFCHEYFPIYFQKKARSR
jgi:hypothetical protein